MAAVSAVLLYNAITRAVAGYRLKLADAATQVMVILGRDLESDGSTRKAGVAVLAQGATA